MAKKNDTTTEDTVLAEEPTTQPSEPVQTGPVDSDRRARWEAFLEKARAAYTKPEIFDAQRLRGEFDKIPDWI